MNKPSESKLVILKGRTAGEYQLNTQKQTFADRPAGKVAIPKKFRGKK